MLRPVLPGEAPKSVGFTGRSTEKRRFFYVFFTGRSPEKRRFLPGEATKSVGCTGRSSEKRRVYRAKPPKASGLPGEAPQERRVYWAKPPKAMENTYETAKALKFERPDEPQLRTNRYGRRGTAARTDMDPAGPATPHFSFSHHFPILFLSFFCLRASLSLSSFLAPPTTTTTTTTTTHPLHHPPTS